MVPDDPDRPAPTGQRPATGDADGEVAAPDVSVSGDVARAAASDADADADAAGDADAGAVPEAELRAKDLLTRSRAEVEEMLDPATLAELSSWFDRPSIEQVQEQLEQAAAAAPVGLDEWGLATADADAAAALERRAELAAHVDPAVQQLLERHTQAADRMFPPPLELPPPVDESIINQGIRAQLDLIIAASEGDPDLSRSLEPPADIVDAIERHNVPQAILRDLARPDSEFAIQFESPFDDEENVFVDAHREVIEAITWRPDVLAEVASMLRFTEVARDCEAQFRDITSEPWGDHLLEVKRMRGKTEDA